MIYIGKVCYKCAQYKENTEFYKNSSKKDGLAVHCKVCEKERHKLTYRTSADRRQKIKDKNKRNKENNKKKMLDFLKNKSCMDCGTTDTRVLEFDHQRDKKADISRLMAGNGWETILNEIDKCEIVCCNCHRIRTLTQFNSYRLEAKVS